MMMVDGLDETTCARVRRRVAGWSSRRAKGCAANVARASVANRTSCASCTTARPCAWRCGPRFVADANKSAAAIKSTHARWLPTRPGTAEPASTPRTVGLVAAIGLLSVVWRQRGGPSEAVRTLCQDPGTRRDRVLGYSSGRDRRATRRHARPRTSPGGTLKTKILVSLDPWETRVALLEDGRTAECYIERRGQRSVVGHVWKGRVGNVLAGMEAAFIDVGLPKSGFLHVDEVVAVGVPKHKRQIAELLKKGDEVLVAGDQGPDGDQGVPADDEAVAGRAVCGCTSLWGRLGREPQARSTTTCGVCARSVSALPLEGGLIVRTAAAGASAEDIARDYAALRRLWAALSASAARR